MSNPDWYVDLKVRGSPNDSIPNQRDQERGQHPHAWSAETTHPLMFHVEARVGGTEAHVPVGVAPHSQGDAENHVGESVVLLLECKNGTKA